MIEVIMGLVYATVVLAMIAAVCEAFGLGASNDRPTAPQSKQVPQLVVKTTVTKVTVKQEPKGVDLPAKGIAILNGLEELTFGDW